MEQRISLITLAVDDLGCAAAFYQALGWTREKSGEDIAVFNLNGCVFGLYARDSLARDMSVAPERLGTGGVTLAYNTRSKPEVAQVLAAAKAAGGTVLREGYDVFWGGHVGYFEDPEGHIWEVAWNPHTAVRGDGTFQWGTG